MFATVRRYEGVTNPSEAARGVSEGFVPLISQIPGFVAYYLLGRCGGWCDDFHERFSGPIRCRRIRQKGCELGTG